MKRNRFENEFERIRFENWNPGIDRLTQVNSSYRSRRISLLRSDFFLQMYLENMKIDLKMNVKEFVENWNPGIGRSSRLKLIRGRDESLSDFFLQIYLENRFENEFGKFDWELKVRWPVINNSIYRGIGRSSRSTYVNLNYWSRRIFASIRFLLNVSRDTRIGLKMNLEKFDRRELESWNRPIVSIDSS